MIEIIQYKPINKGSLQGTFSICVEKWGNLVIRDMGYFKKENNRWITFPAKMWEKDGEKKYMVYLNFKETNTMKNFQEKVLQQLDLFIKNNSEYLKPSAEQMEIPF